MEAGTSERFSFSRFASQPFYETVNARLVELAAVEGRQRVLDLGCGTGGVTRLILERLRELRDGCVIAVDASQEALRIARRNLASWGDAVQYVQAQAEQFAQSLQQRRSEPVDAVLLCNAIHMIEGKDRVVDQVAGVLAPGGVFAFNTTFFDGAQPPETSPFYRRWMIAARRYLMSTHGLRPSREKVTARQQLSVGDYERLLHGAGLEVTEEHVEAADITLEGWLAISQYREFAHGALPGVGPKEAVEALQETVTQVFADLDLGAVPRLWLQVVAVRPSGAPA